MNQRTQQALDVVAEVSEISDATARLTRIKALCGDDDELLTLVNEILQAAPPSRFLADPASLTSGEVDDELPDRIGPFEIIDRLGSGGMGTVYLARQPELGRSVALKLVRFGTLIPDFGRRLREEARLLAQLSHPNIAVVITADVTPEGVPFYAMEYVSGKPIDAYCDEHVLPVEQRIRLFLQACAAVQHAHESFIVHRDIKPSNILVDDSGTVKLLDFGIAKALEADMDSGAQDTQVGGTLLTPAYASPEQLMGQPVSAASDVFSLGVVLHELLCGQRPVKSTNNYVTRPSASVADGNVNAIAEQIAAARGLAPARLRRMLRGDLDNICLKALEHDPEQRYPSVRQFADDIQRYLDGHPVEAQAPSRLYRTRKFLSRNRLGVAAGIALFLTVITGFVATSWQASVARTESVRANEVKRFLVDIFRSSDPRFQADIDSVTARDLLDRGYERVLTELADQPDVRIDLLSELSEIYLSQGVADRSAELSRIALRDRRRYQPRNTEGIGADLVRLGTALNLLDKSDSAAVYQEEAYALARSSRDLPAQAAIATTLADTYHKAQDYERSSAYAIESANLYSRLPVPDSTASLDLARALTTIGLRGAMARRDTARALDMIRRAGTIYQGAFGPTHPRTIGNKAALANAYVGLDRPDAAVRLFTEVLELSKQRFSPNDQDMVWAYWDLGHAAKLAGDLDLSRRMLTESLNIDRTRHGATHRDVLSTRLQLAEVDRLDGRAEAAIDSLDEIIPAFDPTNFYHPLAILTRAEAKIDIADYPGALTDLQAALEAMVGFVGPDNYRNADALVPMTYVNLKLNRPHAAVASAREGARVRDTSDRVDAGRRSIAHLMLGVAQVEAGDVADGSARIREHFDAALAATGREDHPYMLLARAALTATANQTHQP